MTEEIEPTEQHRGALHGNANHGVTSAPHSTVHSDQQSRLSITDVSVLATATLIATSVAYEWFYFRILGPDLISYVSAADLLTLLVSWLPSVTLGWIVYYCVVELPTVGAEKGMTEEEIVSSSPNPRLTQRLRRSPYVLLPYSAIPIILLQIFIVPNGSYLLLAFAVFLLWVPLAARILSLPRLRQRYARRARLLIMFIPAGLCYIGGMGASEAQRDLLLDHGDHSVVTKTKDVEIQGCVLLRSLAEGVLIRIPSEDRIEFISWNAIDRVHRVSAPLPRQSRACRWWGLLCSPEEQSEPRLNP